VGLEASVQRGDGSGGRWAGEQVRLSRFDGGEGAAVDGAGSESLEGAEVIGSAVAFVLGEAVAGVELVELEHETVACDLGEDTGGCDARAQGIAFDEGGLGKRDAGDVEAVDEDVIWRGLELMEGEEHGLVGGVEDVDGVDAVGFHASDGVMDGGVRGEEGEEGVALGGGELFGVVKPGEVFGQAVVIPIGGQDNCGGHDWAGERAAAGFVESGDSPGAVEGQLAFEREAIDLRRRGGRFGRGE
jgi:hypothetical protein